MEARRLKRDRSIFGALFISMGIPFLLVVIPMVLSTCNH